MLNKKVINIFLTGIKCSIHILSWVNHPDTPGGRKRSYKLTYCETLTAPYPYLAAHRDRVTATAGFAAGWESRWGVER